MPEASSLIIIGAGVAGLLAARDLARAGRRVVVLEARDRVGGRIHTLQPAGFSAPIEAGAEFIHGEAPISQALLREAGVPWHDTGGQAYEVQRGHVQESEESIDDMPRLMEQLQALQQDLSLADFLALHFPADTDAELREQVTRMAEGYDAADPQRASTLALRDEWAAGGAEDSPRPQGGYRHLVEHLRQQAEAAGATIELAAAVRCLRWQPGQVTAECAGGRQYQAAQALITVPLGVLQAAETEPGHLRFEPELPAQRAAAAQLGFGAVVKVLLEFDAPFWTEQSAPGHSLPELGFLFSDAPIPTWWSQLPDERPILTGWLGGPPAAAHRTASAEALEQLALESLGYVLGTTPEYLRTRLRGAHVANWAADERARGAYAYVTVDTHRALPVLSAPVADTLYFAGEGIYQGPAMGTVEAALHSATRAVHLLLP
ncbi:flavin monoamine oxidase family protein [Hymenobacter sp. CRA2]|uniref:flavin monoamine oxidase family protein n=1 Tax=Hymenobacter sp. CRA2 TaxID=1955620 RepID=UPI00098EBC37|nr:NAD(P)/FAD-dependent oxidoreductase [Hymenobacter sp. CRA2]OON66468.1 hypothetical protein B0919_21795 [Hymenobacter sp. CRA2]